MISFERASNYPNILLVYGNEISPGTDNRGTLKDFLYSAGASTSPIRRGTHDFWLTYVLGSNRGPNHTYEDMSITPRRMRGIIEMGDIPSINTSNLQGHLATLTQEFAHHWLVPYDLLFRDLPFWPSPAGVCGMPGVDLVTLSLNEGTPFSGPLLLGRQDSHWSSFFQADASAYDGLFWNEIRIEDGYQVWQQANMPLIPTPSVTPAGQPRLGTIQLVQQYNDLDLLIMGVKTPQEAYNRSANQFRWLEPHLTAPLDYHAGLCIAFSQYDYFYFGFYRDHRQLGIQQTGQNLILLDLNPLGYRPLASRFNGIALRIVRRGNNYYFQARMDNPTGSEISARLLGNIDPLPSQTDPPQASLDVFRTLAILTHTGTPAAMGFIVKTWDSILCDAAFLNLEVLDSTTESVLNTGVMAPLWEYLPSTGYDTLPVGSLVFHRPGEGCRLRTEDSRLHIIAPYQTIRSVGNEWPNNDSLETINLESFDHWTSVDRAPKLLTKSPNGDFAVATSAKINRATLSPWAGGAAVGKTMWGSARSATTSNVILNDRMRTKQNSPGPFPDDPPYTYKIAFILMAQQRSEFFTNTGLNQKIGDADTIRRYWDAAFDALTLNRRHVASIL